MQQLDAGRSPSMVISNGVVALLSDYTGRGANRARTYINEDAVTVVLQDTLTRGERSLVADGNAEMVLSMRKAFQTTMRVDLTALVEQVTGRAVIAFLSDNHIDPDIAVETFILQPRKAGRDDAT